MCSFFCAQVCSFFCVSASQRVTALELDRQSAARASQAPRERARASAPLPACACKPPLTISLIFGLEWHRGLCDDKF